MCLTRKQCLYLILASLICLALYFVPILGQLEHGLVELIYGGSSFGKTAFIFSFLIFSSLVAYFTIPQKSFSVKRFALNKKSAADGKPAANLPTGNEKFVKFSFALIIIFAVIGFYLGFLQFQTFKFEYGAQFSNFASLSPDSETLAWEASSLVHNHFPKIAVCQLTQTLGLSIKTVDDGCPLYSVFPDAQLWSTYLILVIVVLFALYVLHLLSFAKRLGIFDFLLLNAAVVGLVINILDGGIFSELVVATIFFTALYVFRNFDVFKNQFFINKFILPILVTLVIAFFLRIFSGTDSVLTRFSFPLLIFLFLLYAIPFAMRKYQTRRAVYALIPCAILFFISFFIVFEFYVPLAFGQPCADWQKTIYNTENLEPGCGLLIYGIPGSEKFDYAGQFFYDKGKIYEIQRKKWVEFIRLEPLQEFKTGMHEAELRAQLNPKGYFFIETQMPIKKQYSYRVFADDASQIQVSAKFLGMEKISETKNPNSVDVQLYTLMDSPWDLLMLLSEIRANGYEGKLVVGK